MKKYLYVMILALPSVLCGSYADQLIQKGVVYKAPLQQQAQSGVVSQPTYSSTSNGPVAPQSNVRPGIMYMPLPGQSQNPPVDIPSYMM